MDKKVKQGEVEAKRAKASVGKKVAGGVAAGIAVSAAEQAVNNVAPTRAAVNQAVSDEVRKVPILGNVIDIAEKAGYVAHLGKLFGRKKK